MSCKSGEVILILGEDSSGKSRLLTAISEAIVSPPKSSRTTIIARGKILVGDVDTIKWDKSRIKRKVGIFINDARTIADISQYFSGSTLSDILQPICPDLPQPLRGSTFSNAVSLATKISGISKTIIPGSPSKLLTSVTANEDELSKHSDLKIMSASSWSKIILAKVLAQVIACNDNPLASPNALPKCLLGSVLLLDDATTYMDEVEEVEFLKALRSSGAATVLTSKRWALGRLVDKIIIMNNGAVVESGTHASLLAKGSMHSVYARKWSEMQQ